MRSGPFEGPATVKPPALQEDNYFNWLAADATPRELVNVLRAKAYISLESALREYGISTQSPQVLTCVTTERPREFNAKTIRIGYRGISPRLYWGYLTKSTRYSSYQIAEPEKALLDWIYLNLQTGVVPAFDELDVGKLSRRKLVEYAQRFPSTVYKLLMPVLAHGNVRRLNGSGTTGK